MKIQQDVSCFFMPKKYIKIYSENVMLGKFFFFIKRVKEVKGIYDGELWENY